MSYTVGRGTEPATSRLDKPGDKLSLGVAARLSRYLQVLTQARKIGKETISSQELADYTHVNSTQIRRDLSGFGKFGKRGVGYNVESLVTQIRKILRTSGQHNIAPVRRRAPGHGDRHVGHLRRPRLPGRGGLRLRPRAGRHADRLAEVRHELRAATRRSSDQEIVVAVLAVPSAAAQVLADQLVQAGVKIIFNYSEALLQVPPEGDRSYLLPSGRSALRAVLLPDLKILRYRTDSLSRGAMESTSTAHARPSTRRQISPWVSRRSSPCWTRSSSA